MISAIDDDEKLTERIVHSGQRREMWFLTEDGLYESLFLAKDVAEWLDMDVSNASRMIKNVDEDECVTVRHNMTSATFLTEDGLYEVLMQSRKPIAKELGYVKSNNVIYQYCRAK